MHYKLFICSLISFVSVAFCYQPYFVVVIPSYNNQEWCQRNLLSVLDQEYDLFNVIYIDDCSKDDTLRMVQELVGGHPQGRRVSVIANKERHGALYNLYHTIHSCPDHHIIVTVDGDDWLANNHVLTRLASEYQSGEVWLTHGDFAWWPNGARSGLHAIHPSYIECNAIRQYIWVSSHLRTFYAGLFKKIKLEDLLYQGEFYPVTWDLAMMFPMLEMSGFHTRYIDEVLYQYNYATPFNDAKTNRELMEKLEYHIRDLPRYEKLEALFDQAIFKG